MLKTKTILLLITSICVIEIVIYLWAIWTTDSEFVFDKCARNSGRASSAIQLMTLGYIGYYGLKKIYLNPNKIDTFRMLIGLFAINHLIHFYFVFQNFKHHTMELNVSENLHGFITFIFILIFPLILWKIRNLSTLLYFGILIHLFNVSYFIMETFYSKIKPDYPAYHNRFGIVVISLALFYILYRVLKEFRILGSR